MIGSARSTTMGDWHGRRQKADVGVIARPRRQTAKLAGLKECIVRNLALGGQMKVALGML
jgi:hypothetical protein